MSEKEKAISLALGTTNENYKDKSAEAEALGHPWAGLYWYIVTHQVRLTQDGWDWFTDWVKNRSGLKDREAQVQEICALGQEWRKEKNP